jgi:hypothetical protein
MSSSSAGHGLFVLFSVLCTAYSYRFFSAAFPVLSLEISMARSEALSKAAGLHGNF